MSLTKIHVDIIRTFIREQDYMYGGFFDIRKLRSWCKTFNFTDSEFNQAIEGFCNEQIFRQVSVYDYTVIKPEFFDTGRSYIWFPPMGNPACRVEDIEIEEVEYE